MTTNKTAETDWEGLKYPLKTYLKTRKFDGEVGYDTIDTLNELKAAFEYGRYLEKQGYKSFVMGEVDPLTFKMAWYFSTAGAGMTDAAHEVEMVFAIKTDIGLLIRSGIVNDREFKRLCLASKKLTEKFKSYMIRALGVTELKGG